MNEEGTTIPPQEEEKLTALVENEEELLPEIQDALHILFYFDHSKNSDNHPDDDPDAAINAINNLIEIFSGSFDDPTITKKVANTREFLSNMIIGYNFRKDRQLSGVFDQIDEARAALVSVHIDQSPEQRLATLNKLKNIKELLAQQVDAATVLRNFEDEEREAFNLLDNFDGDEQDLILDLDKLQNELYKLKRYAISMFELGVRLQEVISLKKNVLLVKKLAKLQDREQSIENMEANISRIESGIFDSALEKLALRRRHIMQPVFKTMGVESYDDDFLDNLGGLSQKDKIQAYLDDLQQFIDSQEEEDQKLSALKKQVSEKEDLIQQEAKKQRNPLRRTVKFMFGFVKKKDVLPYVSMENSNPELYELYKQVRILEAKQKSRNTNRETVQKLIKDTKIFLQVTEDLV